MGMLAYREKKWQTDQTFDKKTEKVTFVSDLQAPDSCKDVKTYRTRSNSIERLSRIIVYR